MCKEIESEIIKATIQSALSGDMDNARMLRCMLNTGDTVEHAGIKRAKKAGLIPGTNVIFPWTTGEGSSEYRKGTIKEFRTRVGGLYCADRYPISVHLFEEGHTFEYDLDSVLICEDFDSMYKYLPEHRQLALDCMSEIQNRNRIRKLLHVVCIDSECDQTELTVSDFLENYNNNYLYQGIYDR